VFTLGKTTTKPLFYQGKLIGNTDGRGHFTPALDALETLDLLIEEVPIGVRVHLRAQAPVLQRLANFHGLKPGDYINPYEAGIFASTSSRGKDDLHRHAPVAWRILHNNGLELKVYSQLQPS